jgi:hypothetical protein
MELSRRGFVKKRPAWDHSFATAGRWFESGCPDQRQSTEEPDAPEQTKSIRELSGFVRGTGYPR